MNGVHFKSEVQTWETPADLFDQLDQEFAFDLDVCALPETSKCKRYFTPADDGLSQSWTGTCWMNPPYGRAIGNWMRKALEESRRGCIVVCLVPARTDTEWWHRFAMRGEIRFIRGRLKFGNAKSGAPFPSAIVVFRDRWWERRQPGSSRTSSSPASSGRSRSASEKYSFRSSARGGRTGRTTRRER